MATGWQNHVATAMPVGIAYATRNTCPLDIITNLQEKILMILAAMITLTLVIAKIWGNLAISWFWAFAPLWIAPIGLLLLYVIAMIVLLVE